MTSVRASWVPGIRVGHYTDEKVVTGCTVVLCEPGAVGGVDVRGSAPGTRETELLRPTNLVAEAHAVLLSGGSAFGLDAASGVVRYLEERGVGFRVGDLRVPIVPAAVLFDLGVGDARVRPGPEEGYWACLSAAAADVAQGSVGAGTGATVGKLLGPGRAVKGGVGAARIDVGGGTVVGSVVAVNAAGSVFDAERGVLVAGPHARNGDGMLDCLVELTRPGSDVPIPLTGESTTIGVVATNARLTVEQANKLASVAHDGIAMSVRPAHTMVDGDTVFALATGLSRQDVDMLRLCAAAALSMSRAIVSGVLQARSLGGVPTATDLLRQGDAGASGRAHVGAPIPRT